MPEQPWEKKAEKYIGTDCYADEENYSFSGEESRHEEIVVKIEICE
jgi:hypothetical protein